MDHPAHDLNTEAYRRLSPFEQIPVATTTGSGAVRIRRHPRLPGEEVRPPDSPATAPARRRWLRWCFAAMNSVEPPLLSLLVLDWTADGSCGKHREFLVGWANRVLTNLERWFR